MAFFTKGIIKDQQGREVDFHNILSAGSYTLGEKRVDTIEAIKKHVTLYDGVIHGLKKFLKISSN